MAFLALTTAGRRPLPARVRREVMDRDGSVCAYCGDTDGPFHIDHIFPYSRGGSDDPENLTVACQTCNFSKGAMTVEEWGGANG
ncbi:HNH endonuclease [Paracoccus angustae]|uniref:HNH endonuclease n=1 Tax=Paracoccus angustae TaxID=1671480 RepID=A0ABV7TZK1_9RHOB